MLSFQLLQVIMQIRFATMGKKNKHERNPKKSTKKVWNPKKEKKHRTKRQICKHVFFGFALLSSASGDYANQICNGGEEKKHQQSPKKNTEKVWNRKKEKNHKTKRQICKHCFFGFALLCFQVFQVIMQIRFTTMGKRKKNIRKTLRKIQKKSGTLRKKEKNHKTKHCIITYMSRPACNYWQLSQEVQQQHTCSRKQPILSASCPLSSQTHLPLPPDPPSLLLSVQIILHLQKKLQQLLHLL